MEGGGLDERLLAQSKDIIKRLKQLESAPEWKENGDKFCQKFKMEIGDRVASKGVHICDFSFERVVEFINKEETLAKMNPQIIEIKVLYVGKGFRVNYQQYKGMWPVSNRDFVSLVVVEKQEGKVYIGSRGCDYQWPEVKGVVRGEVIIGGYIVEKIDQGRTRVTYISDVDLKGSIPGLLRNSLSERQGGLASKVAYCLNREK